MCARLRCALVPSSIPKSEVAAHGVELKGSHILTRVRNDHQMVGVSKALESQVLVSISRTYLEEVRDLNGSYMRRLQLFDEGIEDVEHTGVDVSTSDCSVRLKEYDQIVCGSVHGDEPCSSPAKRFEPSLGEETVPHKSISFCGMLQRCGKYHNEDAVATCR